MNFLTFSYMVLKNTCICWVLQNRSFRKVPATFINFRGITEWFFSLSLSMFMLLFWLFDYPMCYTYAFFPLISSETKRYTFTQFKIHISGRCAVSSYYTRLRPFVERSSLLDGKWLQNWMAFKFREPGNVWSSISTLFIITTFNS